MSYTEVINEETVKFIQKTTELILQFRDFDKNTYKSQLNNEGYINKDNILQQGENELYDTSFQLVNQTFFGFIRKHAQNFQNWTMPEAKELTIEIFGQNKITQNNDNQYHLNKNNQQNYNNLGEGKQQQHQQQQQQNQNQRNRFTSDVQQKMEEWRFVFRHLDIEEDSSDQIQRVMNPQQFVMNLSILTRSILSILTNLPIFKDRDSLKITRRVHFTRGTVKDFDITSSQYPLKIETFSKKIYLLHHVLEFQVRYLIDSVNNEPQLQQQQYSTDNTDLLPQISLKNNKQQSYQNQMSSFSIYSHIDDSTSQRMSKQVSQIEKQEGKNSKDGLKHSNQTTNQSIFDMDFSNITSSGSRNTYSPPNFAQNKQQMKAPKKYSEDLTLFKDKTESISPELKPTNKLIQKEQQLIREKSHTCSEQNDDESYRIERRNTEIENKSDLTLRKLDSLLDSLHKLGDPYITNNTKRSTYDVLQKILI